MVACSGFSFGKRRKKQLLAGYFTASQWSFLQFLMVCKTKVFVSRTFSTRHLFPAVYCFRLNLSMRNKTGTTRFLGKWSPLSLRVSPADQKAWGLWVRGFPESTRCRVEVCQPYTGIKKRMLCTPVLLQLYLTRESTFWKDFNLTEL